MGGRGASAYSYEQWKAMNELDELRYSSYRPNFKEEKLPYNIIRSTELHAGASHAFFDDTDRAFSVITYDATDTVESLNLASADTFGTEPIIRWISDGQVNDVYLHNMSLDQFNDMTNVDISMPKGGYVASKRMSRVFRDYRVQMFLPDNELNIQYLERDDTRDAIWDGAGLVNREVLKKMQLGPLETAIEELEFEIQKGKIIANGANSDTLKEALADSEPLLQVESVRTEAEIKLAKLRGRHKKLSRELATCNRIEYTIMTEKGQDKGHAIVCDNLMADDGKTEVDFILLDSDTKPETKLTEREWVGINFVHGHDHMKLDSQSLIHMQELFPPEYLSTCVEQEGELFLKALENGNAGAAMQRVDRNETIEDVTGWPLREFIVSGGDVRWSPHLSKMLTNQHLKPIDQMVGDKINISIPGGRYYVIPDAVGQRGGATDSVPRGQIKIDQEYGTAWVSSEDWLALPDSPSGQGLASIWGGADNDDALWIYPFTDYDNEKKVLAWRSPNLMGEYVILKPTADTPKLEFETVNGKVSYPKADSRKLPPRIDHLLPIESKINPESAGKVGAGEEYSVEAMAPAIERAKQNAGAVGLFCNSLMTEAGLWNGRPEDLPAALDHVIDAAVKTGADLTLVKQWCVEHTKQLLRRGMPIPKLLKKRLAHDRNRDPNELVPPIINTPKDSQHFLDRIDRHLTQHIESIKERRETTEVVIPTRLMEAVYIEDRQKYGNEILTAGAKLNQHYGYVREQISKRKRWGHEDDAKLEQQIETEISEMDDSTRHRELRQFLYEEIFTAQAKAKRRRHPYVPGQRDSQALLTDEEHDAIVANTDQSLECLIQNNQVEEKLQEFATNKRKWFAKERKKEWTDADHNELRGKMLYEMTRYPPDTRKAVVRAAMVSAYMNDKTKSDAAVWVPGPETSYGRMGGIDQITIQALREIGLLDQVTETRDGVIVYPDAHKQPSYSSVGIKGASFNWYKNYAHQKKLKVPIGFSKEELAKAGTSRKEVMELFKEAAFDYQDTQIVIEERVNTETKEQKLIAYTHDGVELGEVTDPSKVARGLQFKIEFAFPRSGTLQIAFDKDATKDIIF